MNEGHRGTPGAVVHEGVDVEGGDTLAGERHEQLVDGQRAGVAGVHGALEVVDEDPRGDRLIRGVLDGEQWSHEPVSSCLVWFILPRHGAVGALAARGDGRARPTAPGRACPCRAMVMVWAWPGFGARREPTSVASWSSDVGRPRLSETIRRFIRIRPGECPGTAVSVLGTPANTFWIVDVPARAGLGRLVRPRRPRRGVSRRIMGRPY